MSNKPFIPNISPAKPTAPAAPAPIKPIATGKDNGQATGRSVPPNRTPD